MANIIKPRVLKGFRDFLPQQEIQRQETRRLLEQSFESYGFVPIDTPALEYSEVLLGKGGGETDKQMYRFNDHGGRDVALRFDLTVPFARFMAAHKNELGLPFKRYHISRVWRGENTQRGRYREFTQCDFDIVGTDSASADFEILCLMRDSLQNLKVPSCRIHLSHRGIFNRFLAHLNMEDQNVAILRGVDKLAKMGREKVIELLKESITEDQALQVLSFIEREEDFESTLAKMTRLAGGPAEDTRRMQEIYSCIKANQMEDIFVLDPSITRGLDYYTGLVYETFLSDLPQLGSVCSGGRYNNLASLYSKEEIPGVGASIGLDRLLAGLEELKVQSPRKGNTDILVIHMDEDLLAHYHGLSRAARQQGFSAEVYPESKKMGQQFKYAEQKDIPLALICGSREAEGGTVNLKDLQKRESFNQLSLSEALAKAKEILSQ